MRAAPPARERTSAGARAVACHITARRFPAEMEQRGATVRDAPPEGAPALGIPLTRTWVMKGLGWMSQILKAEGEAARTCRVECGCSHLHTVLWCFSVTMVD